MAGRSVHARSTTGAHLRRVFDRPGGYATQPSRSTEPVPKQTVLGRAVVRAVILSNHPPVGIGGSVS